MSLRQLYRPEYWKSFTKNTLNYVSTLAADTFFLRPFQPPPNEKLLFDFNGPHALEEWGLGCDQDIGGHSTARLSLTRENKVCFSGNISLALTPGSDAVYSGFAAMRSHTRLPQHLFDNRNHDCSRWLYLKLRLRGDHRTYNFNFKPNRSFSGDLYMTRFKFLKPYEWEDVILPFDYFIRTNCGSEYMRQYPPNLEKVVSFGFLVADNLPGPFHLELDSITLTNLNFDHVHDVDGREPESTAAAAAAGQPKPDPSLLTRHLFDPHKRRQDTVDSMRNNYGFGFDMGDGMIEAADDPRNHRWTNKHPDRVDNPAWTIKVRPDKRVKARTEVAKEQQEAKISQ